MHYEYDIQYYRQDMDMTDVCQFYDDKQWPQTAMSLPTFVGDHSRAGTPEPTLVDKVQGAFNHYSTYHGHNQIFSPISHTNVHQCQNPASSLSSSCNTYLPHANTDSQVHPRIPLSVEFLGAGSYDQSSTMSCQPQGRYKVNNNERSRGFPAFPRLPQEQIPRQDTVGQHPASDNLPTGKRLCKSIKIKNYNIIQTTLKKEIEDQQSQKTKVIHEIKQLERQVQELMDTLKGHCCSEGTSSHNP